MHSKRIVFEQSFVSEQSMRLSTIIESKMLKYMKVVEDDKKPDIINIIPGYMTSEHKTVGGYLSAFMSVPNSLKVWVIETSIDIARLKRLDGLIIGSQRNILPGYHGTEISPDDGIPTPLSVIVWNEPINCKVVGGYIKNKNYDFTSGRMNAYKKDGNAWRDNVNGSYTFDDFDGEPAPRDGVTEDTPQIQAVLRRLAAHHGHTPQYGFLPNAKLLK